MSLVDKIVKVNELLNEIDDYGNSLETKLSIVNGKIQDLLHYIENNRINILWCYSVLKQIKNLREERRKIKNDIELFAKYNDNRSKLLARNGRKYLEGEMIKKEKSLQTEYKNRQYSDEDIQEILKGGKNE